VVTGLQESTFTKFYGGSENGLSLQISLCPTRPPVEDDWHQNLYLKLDNRQVKELLAHLEHGWGGPPHQVPSADLDVALLSRLTDIGMAFLRPMIEGILRDLLKPKPLPPIPDGPTRA